VSAGPPIEAARLAAATPWLGRVRATGPGTPLEGGDVLFRFPRLDVLAPGPESGPFILQLAGEIPGLVWITGSDTLRDEGPHGASKAPSPQTGGETLPLTWVPRSGMMVDLHQSLDGGATWTAVARGLERGAWDYRVPRVTAQEAWIELEASDAAGYAGSAFIGPFEILAGDPLPERFALAVAGTHPARVPVALELALPEARDVRVDIFDLRGARVATLADGRFAAGRHRIEWNGADRGGGVVPPGVYFTRAVAGTQEARARIVLVR
jgi:hypothetical protein